MNDMKVTTGNSLMILSFLSYNTFTGLPFFLQIQRLANHLKTSNIKVSAGAQAGTYNKGSTKNEGTSFTPQNICISMAALLWYRMYKDVFHKYAQNRTPF